MDPSPFPSGWRRVRVASPSQYHLPENEHEMYMEVNCLPSCLVQGAGPERAALETRGAGHHAVVPELPSEPSPEPPLARLPAEGMLSGLGV